jgi:hypothetical protein
MGCLSCGAGHDNAPQFLSVRRLGRCPIAYIAPSTAGPSTEEETRRIRQMVLAEDTGVSAGKRGNAKKSEEYDRRVADFFLRRARPDQIYSTRAICRAIFGHNDFTDATLRVVERSFRRVAPRDWYITVRSGRFRFVHNARADNMRTIPLPEFE